MVAVKGAEKVGRGALAFLRVAFDTRGDKVAVGVAATLDAWNDVVDTSSARREASETVEAEAPLALVDEFAKRADFKEVHVLEARRDRQATGGAPL